MVKDAKFIVNLMQLRRLSLASFHSLLRILQWFELLNCFVFHIANAWEEGDEVVLVACRLQNPDLDQLNGLVKEKIEKFTGELYEMRINLENGLASQKRISMSTIDFCMIN